MVTVVVVSWNTRQLLLQCLASLEPEVKAGCAEVYVVDNGSVDDSPAAARQAAPWAQVIEPGDNVGFGRAINIVARQTTCRWILAANADIALAPDALAALLNGGRNDRVGCVAPRLVLPDGQVQHSVHPFPTIPLTLAFNLGLHRLSPRAAERMCLEGFWNPDRPRLVPWAIGACLLLRRVAFEEIGGFDEERWLFAEDLDLGWRLRQHGWLTRYEPSARVLHHASASTERVFGERRRRRFMAATYSTLLSRRGRVRMWLTATINIMGAVGRLAWLTPLSLVSGRRRGQRSEAASWLRAHLGGVSDLSRPSPAP